MKKSSSENHREAFVEDMARALLATLCPDEFAMPDEDTEGDFTFIPSLKK